ncbi:hypothetical protein D6817_00880 [Candidatus Pacearchaeota archaeon]|nr:MAG: hypothetical protein D6817_00880 [Candidatus Pacearchaeota archaeon]
MIEVSVPVRIDISPGWTDAEPFCSSFGGAVLNAAISLRAKVVLAGNKLISSLEKIPSESGLGTSGAVRAAYLVAVAPSLARNKTELIKKVHEFENKILEEHAGLQDQAAAIFGGVNFWRFSSRKIERKPLAKRVADELEGRIALLYTGEKHLSYNVHKKVYSSRNYARALPKLKKLKKISERMFSSINKQNPNWESFAELMNLAWSVEKTLYNGIETQRMRKLRARLGELFLSARATGAGGGGSMIFFTTKEKLPKLKQALKKESKQMPNSCLINFRFDHKGMIVKRA